MPVIDTKEKLQKSIDEIVGVKKIKRTEENKKSFVLIMRNYCINPNPENITYEKLKNQTIGQLKKDSKSLIEFLKSENVSYVDKRLRDPLKFGIFEYIVLELGHKAFRLIFKKSAYFIEKYGNYTKDVDYQDKKNICEFYEYYVENPWILSSLISISSDNLKKIVTGTTTVFEADSKIRILIPREIRMRKLGYDPDSVKKSEVPSFAKGFRPVAIPKSARRSKI